MTGYSHETYIIRVWLEPSTQGGAAWRATLVNAGTKEKCSFADPEGLCRFLARELGLAPASSLAGDLG